MDTFSNQTTIECCLSISICFILLFYQSITSQTSIIYLFVLNYEFPLVFPFPFVFAIPFIPLPFPLPTIPDPIPFSMIECGYGNRREVFPSVSIHRSVYSTWSDAIRPIPLCRPISGTWSCCTEQTTLPDAASASRSAAAERLKPHQVLAGPQLRPPMLAIYVLCNWCDASGEVMTTIYATGGRCRTVTGGTR
jgi:hypothetical protein